ncbi:peptidoglycan-recognition protein LF-like [Macrosteles quadrilineatus]|uniref:peptidoglycan-recognition protein LF-like n=1 Tax=Macrosteles quadrilineatus TaxID=74068 RepID=UPI0023E2E625|nr:peptidoglycan-recognition protein LF-like [Macrosteles quadrilineatus]
MSATPPFIQGSVPPPPPDATVATVFSRYDWGAIPPRKTLPPLTTPVTKVVTSWAHVEPCLTVDECKQRVREIQKKQMEEDKLDDIEYNFLIGGDGNIYEGRGWYNVGPVYPSDLAYANDLNGKSVEFAFLDKIAVKPNDVHVKATSDCVAYGLVAKFLQEKVQFYLRSPGQIRYLSSYQTNAPGVEEDLEESSGPQTPSKRKNAKRG